MTTPPTPAELREKIELKSCPLCAGSNVQHVPGVFIGCMDVNCGCNVEMGAPWGGPKTDGIAFLVAAWNRRAASEPVVAEGWRLVPVEPSAEMVAAAMNSRDRSSRARYRAMLAAAPLSAFPLLGGGGE